MNGTKTMAAIQTAFSILLLNLRREQSTKNQNQRMIPIIIANNPKIIAVTSIVVSSEKLFVVEKKGVEKKEVE